MKASLERANASIYPTVRLAAAHAAYWCRVPGQGARPLGAAGARRTPALDALARLSAAGDLLLGEGTKFAGMFRAHGLLVPVWDVPARAGGGRLGGAAGRLRQAVRRHPRRRPARWTAPPAAPSRAWSAGS